MGPFEHFYDDYVFGDDISTHYVVLGYKLRVSTSQLRLPHEQHNAYEWYSERDLLNADSVHRHTKWYFDPSAE